MTVSSCYGLIQVPPNRGGILNSASTHNEACVGRIGISGQNSNPTTNERERLNIGYPKVGIVKPFVPRNNRDSRNMEPCPMSIPSPPPNKKPKSHRVV